jgi:hypothetical protein
MKYLKQVLFFATLLVFGLWGFAFLVDAINKHADYAATGIIEDSLASNAAYDLDTLSKIRESLARGEVEEANAIIDQQVELKMEMLKACVSEACINLRESRNVR